MNKGLLLLVLVVAVVLLILFVLGQGLAHTYSSQASQSQADEPPSRERQPIPAEKAQDLIEKMIYFKDTRPEPPVCYAYFWEGVARHGVEGGPALAAVPCAAVERLLVNK